MDIGLSGFFQQIPTIIPVMLCMCGLALLGVVAWSISQRRSRTAAVPAGVSGIGFPSSAGRQPLVNSDMPDLNDLIASPTTTSPMAASTSSASSAAPAPSRPKRGTYSVRLHDGTVVEAAETLVILRDVHEGGLIAQIGDRAYRLPAPATDAEFVRRLAAVSRALAAEGEVAPAPAMAAPILPPHEAGPPSAPPIPASAPVPATSAVPAAMPPAPEPLPPVIPTVPDAPDVPALSSAPVSSDPIELPDLEQLPPLAPPPLMPRASAARPPIMAAPGDLPSFKMPDTMEPPPRFGRRPKKPSSEPIPEINIAASIEAFLQHKMSTLVEWRGRNLHVSSASDGGVRIEVDGRFFDSVGAIDDVTARAFLADTIDEWQSRQR